MSRLNPLYLAWSHLWYKPNRMLGSVLLLSTCLTMFYTQVGLLQVAIEVSGVNLTEVARKDPAQEPGAGSWRMPLVRGFVVGVVSVFLFLVLLLYQVLVPTVASRQRDLTLLYRLGYSPGYLSLVVFAEMMMLIGLACVPAVLVLPIIHALVRTLTELPLALRWQHLGTLIPFTLFLGSVVAWRGCQQIKAIVRREVWDPADLM